VAAALLVTLAPTGWVLALRDRRPMSQGRIWTPEMEEFWRQFLTSPRPVMVLIGAPLFTKVGNTFLRDPALNTWDTASQSAEVHKLQQAEGDTRGDAPISPSLGYTGIGEARGAFELARLLLPRGRELSLQARNTLSWDELTRYDMIFLGPPKYNLETNDLPVRQDFEISHAHVQNLRPRDGDPRSFE